MTLWSVVKHDNPMSQKQDGTWQKACSVWWLLNLSWQSRCYIIWRKKFSNLLLIFWALRLWAGLTVTHKVNTLNCFKLLCSHYYAVCNVATLLDCCILELVGISNGFPCCFAWRMQICGRIQLHLFTAHLFHHDKHSCIHTSRAGLFYPCGTRSEIGFESLQSKTTHWSTCLTLYEERHD